VTSHRHGIDDPGRTASGESLRGTAFPPLFALPGIVFCLALTAFDPSIALASEADPSVESGRRALDHWRRYPWYDRAADDVRRIDVAESWDWNWNWPWWLRFSLPDSLLQWLAWIGLAVLLGLVAYLLFRAYRARRRPTVVSAAERTSSEADDPARIEILPFPLADARLDLLGEVRRHSEAGNYGRAIVYLFSYQLVELDKHQAIQLAKGKTNRQYLRELRRRPGLARLLEQTMVAFEDVFFGNHRLDRDRFDACWLRLGEFHALATEG